MTQNPSLFTLQQKILLDHLRHCRGSPLPVERLVAVLYGAQWDGGPDHADVVVRIQIKKLRQRLSPYGIAILTIGAGRGSQGYMLEPDHLDRLEALLVAMPQIDIDLARARAS